MGRLHLSSFAQERYLPPGHKAELALDRSKVETCIMATDAVPAGGARIEIIDCALHIRRVKVSESVRKAHTNLMIDGMTAKLPVRRIKTHLLAIPQGVRQHQLKVEEDGAFPARLFVGFIKNTAVNGHFQQCATRFFHLNVNRLTLNHSGMAIQKAYEPDFANMNFAREYIHLLEAANQGGNNSGADITQEMFADGCTLFAFDCRADLSDETIEPIKRGHITIDVSFGEETASAYTAFVYAEHYGSFEVDIEGNVTVLGAPVL
jgi:hypothetical protein